jgi:hypothetical protein
MITDSPSKTVRLIWPIGETHLHELWFDPHCRHGGNGLVWSKSLERHTSPIPRKIKRRLVSLSRRIIQNDPTPRTHLWHRRLETTDALPSVHERHIELAIRKAMHGIDVFGVVGFARPKQNRARRDALHSGRDLRIPLWIVLNCDYLAHPFRKPECRPSSAELQYLGVRLKLALQCIDEAKREPWESRTHGWATKIRNPSFDISHLAWTFDQHPG